MIVQEEPGGYVEGDEDVDGVVLVSGEDEEDAENVADPRESVEEVDAPRRVVRYEEVEQGQRDGVAAEHVVSACTDSLDTKYLLLMETRSADESDSRGRRSVTGKPSHALTFYLFPCRSRL